MRGKPSIFRFRPFGMPSTTTGDMEKELTPQESGLLSTIRETKLKLTTVIYLLLGLLIGFMLSNLLREFLHPDMAPKIAQCEIEALFASAKDNMSDHYSKLDDRSVALKLQKEVRVLCLAMTWERNHKTQAYPMQITWGKRCSKMIFMSDKADPQLETIALASTRRWSRTKEVLRYIYEHQLDEADWFLIVDDSTYVVMENLRLLLYPYSSEIPICFGAKLGNNNISGGAGFILSRQAVMQIVETGFDGPKLCSKVGTSEYTALGKCLMNVGLLQGDARDCRGNERFYPFNTNVHVDRKNGLAFTSDRAISFHYLSGLEIYEYEYLIYHARPYGIVRHLEQLPAKLPMREHAENTTTVLGDHQ